MQIRRGEIKLFLFGGYLRVHIKKSQEIKKKNLHKTHKTKFPNDNNKKGAEAIQWRTDSLSITL